MNLRNMQSESSLTQKMTYCVIPLYKIHRIGKFIETKMQTGNSQGLEGGAVGSDCLMDIGVLLVVTKHFGTIQNWWLHNTVNVFITTLK